MINHLSIKKLVFIIFSISFSLISCKSSKNNVELPKEKHYSFRATFKIGIKKDSIAFVFKNPSYSPLRFYISSENKLDEVLLNPHQKKEVQFINNLFLKEDIIKLKRKILYGDLTKNVDSLTPIALPFPFGKTYSILQGNNSSFTHNTIESRYALDFAMNEGQEITAVYDGVVVASIDLYTLGGRNKKLKGYGNYITIYHETLGTYSTYFHLKPNGSLVQPGEKVKQNQIIGYSGHTGYSTQPHLHFVYQKPHKEIVLASIPFRFKDGTKSTDLKKHMKVTHLNND
jgi:murein DD-endopeptidase MepM/ murein hydrolase activator NlpD